MPVSPDTQEVQIRKLMVQDQLRQKVHRAYMGMVVHACHTSYMDGVNKIAKSKKSWGSGSSGRAPA
jgi:hypothetical protein